jgi:dienelactone hydrolase
VNRIREQAFRVENDEGLPIRCDLRLPAAEGLYPVAVIVHGFKGFKDWGMFPPTARLLAERGIATITMNTSRNGVADKLEEFTDLGSFARNTPLREVQDVTRVLDAIASREVDSALDVSRVGLLGHSRGGGVVLLAAAGDERVRCVVTWAAIARFHRWSERAVAEWRRKGRLEVPNQRTGQMMWLSVEVLDDLEANRSMYDLERACRELGVPYLAIHGDLDEAVPVDESRSVHDWAGVSEKRLEVIPGAGHTFGTRHPWEGPSPAWTQIAYLTSSWFGKWLAAE